MAKILSIVPYKFMPPQNGGHWGIYYSEKVFSTFNEVHTVGTQDNRNDKISLPYTHFVINTGKSRYFPFSHYGKVYKLASEIKPDYIVCHHHYMFPLAKRLAGKLNIPLYIRSYNIETERFKSIGKWWWPLMQRFERLAYRKANGVFFITDEDRKYAKHHFGLDAGKIATLPFGTDFAAMPQAIPGARAQLAAAYGLNPDVPWLYFMGQLDYEPNSQAVHWMVYELLPLLKARIPAFHLLVCGKHLSDTLKETIQQRATYQEMMYLGFVPDISALIDSCQVMLNPVTSGGGIKTKVIESLAWNKTVISAETGAIGVEQKVCGTKLRTVPDHDVAAFLDQIVMALEAPGATIPDAFYEYYFTGNIAQRLQAFFR